MLWHHLRVEWPAPSAHKDWNIRTGLSLAHFLSFFFVDVCVRKGRGRSRRFVWTMKVNTEDADRKRKNNVPVYRMCGNVGLATCNNYRLVQTINFGKKEYLYIVKKFLHHWCTYIIVYITYVRVPKTCMKFSCSHQITPRVFPYDAINLSTIIRSVRAVNISWWKIFKNLTLVPVKLTTLFIGLPLNFLLISYCRHSHLLMTHREAF